MKVALIDVDGHHYPNLALMRLSKYHKDQNDEVSWWNPIEHFDIAYASKVFSDTYSKDINDPMNVDYVIRGGTGYHIKNVNGVEVFDGDGHENLPDEIEGLRPDYSIYPNFKKAVSMTSRGCPRQCSFCIVGCKEGLTAHQVAEPMDFYEGQEKIDVLDANILACTDKHRLLRSYQKLGCYINFSQGLDIRLIDDEDISIINTMRIKHGSDLHFAWDNPNEDLRPKLKQFADKFRLKDKGSVYILVNYSSSMEENLFRINECFKLGYSPYVMIYDKPNAPREIRLLQRWCNNKFIFKSVSFEEYDPRRC